MSEYKSVVEENAKFKKAIADLIPWAGCLPDGPSWATDEASKENRRMFEDAMNFACSCFPDDFDPTTQIRKQYTSAEPTRGPDKTTAENTIGNS